METEYIIEVFESNENLKINRYWKQKCNFYIEIIKINTYYEYEEKEKNQSFFYNELRITRSV